MKIEDQQLIRKRKKSYLWFLIMQVAVFFSGSILTSAAAQGQFGLSLPLINPIHMVVVLLLNVFLWLLVSRFMTKFGSILFASGLALVHILQFTSFGMQNNQELAQQLASAGSFLLFLSILYTVITISKDIFMHSHEIDYSLLGAANIYWALGILFASLYMFLETVNPGLMGIEFPTSGEMFYNTYSYSWYIITGIESPFTTTVNNTIRNISILEAAMANLFIIFVVGRLLVSNQKK